ncbi:EamA family transporter [Rapidithrix thailandica]|uniref:EamA family transporter n=1 Tax=Rapidithrix thailandica TaxID=413964 RepID=A0AAW9S1A1_9BACT
MTERKLFIGVLLIFLGACSYGILATFVKMAYQEGFTPGEVTSSQFILGLCILGLINLFYPKKAQKSTSVPSSRSNILKLILAGTSLGLTSTFYYYSVQYIPVSVGIVLLMQSTWMGVLVEALLNKTLPEGKKLLATIIVWIGTILATNVLVEWETLHWKGLAWGILAAISYTVATYSANRVALTLPTVRRSFWLLVGGTLIVLLFASSQLMEKYDYTVLWKWGIVLALFGTVLPPLLFTYGMPLTGIGLGAIITAVEIPVSVIMAMVLLEENVNGMQWLGIAFILLAIVLMNVYKKKVKRQLVAS